MSRRKGSEAIGLHADRVMIGGGDDVLPGQAVHAPATPITKGRISEYIYSLLMFIFNGIVFGV